MNCVNNKEREAVNRQFDHDYTAHDLLALKRVLQREEQNVTANNITNDDQSTIADSTDDQHSDADDDYDDYDNYNYNSNNNSNKRYKRWGQDAPCNHADHAHIPRRMLHKWKDCVYNPQSASYCGFKCKADRQANRNQSNNNNNTNRGYGGPTHQGHYMIQHTAQGPMMLVPLPPGSYPQHAYTYGSAPSVTSLNANTPQSAGALQGACSFNSAGRRKEQPDCNHATEETQLGLSLLSI